jgi:hypothetical protein
MILNRRWFEHFCIRAFPPGPSIRTMQAARYRPTALRKYNCKTKREGRAPPLQWNRRVRDAFVARAGALGASGGGLFQDAAVVGFVGGDYVVGAEFLLGVDAGDLAHFAAAVGAGEDFDGVGGGCFDVAGFH